MRMLIAVFACNEINGVHRGILTAISPTICDIPIDIVLVDDGSTDGTADEAKQQGIEVLQLPRNCGKATAIKIAFTYCLAHQYDLMVTMDCDGQHDTKDLPRFVECLCNGADVALGVRFHEQSMQCGVPFDRILLNRTASAGIKELTGQTFADVLCGYRGFQRRAIEALLPKLEFTGYGGEIEMAFLLASIFPHFIVPQLPIAAIYTGLPELEGLYAQSALEERLQRHLVHLRQLVELHARKISLSP